MALESATYISDLVSTNPTASDPKSQGDDHLRLIKATVKATFPNITGAMTASHTELNYVVGVTSAIQTQINTKGAIAGQAWTGSHTFVTQSAGDNSTKAATTAYVDAADALKANLASPALTGTPTAPTAAGGTNTTQLATTAFVQQQAFSTALPVQTSNATKFLQTDGANASWQNVPIAPDVIMRASTGVSLTAGSFTNTTINTTDRNQGSLASLASNQITLPAGTYYAKAKASVDMSAGGVNHSGVTQARLFNATDSAVIGSAGMGVQVTTGDSDGGAVPEVVVVFTLSGTKAINLQVLAPSATAATTTSAFVEIWRVS